MAGPDGPIVLKLHPWILGRQHEKTWGETREKTSWQKQAWTRASRDGTCDQLWRHDEQPAHEQDIHNTVGRRTRQPDEFFRKDRSVNLVTS